MIPKIMHYCWFGGKPLPDEAKKCISSWKKFCPDYTIREWNEKNFDLQSNQYAYEAYQNKKWAFITDYVRLYAMVTEGGIYMDTDVEVIKPLDDLLVNKAFSGFENLEKIPTGIMACEKGVPLFQQLLNEYDGRHFVKDNGELDLTTNVETITNYCKSLGFVSNNTYQVIEEFTIYPKDWFCPKDYVTGKITLTSNTRTIHHFKGSWKDKNTQIIQQRITFFVGLFGEHWGMKIGQFCSLLPRIKRKIQRNNNEHSEC